VSRVDSTTSSHSDTYHGHFATLVPDEPVVETIEFETSNPELRSVMTMSTTLRDAEGGTDVVVQQKGLPAAVSTADNEAGLR
jgi:Activator of Hsp90 ATPase homolog 1-like protein